MSICTLVATPRASTITCVSSRQPSHPNIMASASAWASSISSLVRLPTRLPFSTNTVVTCGSSTATNITVRSLKWAHKLVTSRCLLLLLLFLAREMRDWQKAAVTLYSNQVVFVFEVNRTTSLKDADKCIDNLFLNLLNCKSKPINLTKNNVWIRPVPS